MQFFVQREIKYILHYFILKHRSLSEECKLKKGFGLLPRAFDRMIKKTRNVGLCGVK